MLSFESLNLLAFLLSVALLGCASYSDLKTREASDKIWMIYMPLAALLLGLRLMLNPHLALIYSVSVVATVVISAVIFCLGLFGGADLKAFICLSVALPTNPLPLGSLLNSSPIFPVGVLYNAYLLSVSMILYCLGRNLVWMLGRRSTLFEGLGEINFFEKIAAVLTGYKTDLNSLRDKVHLYPMEEITVANNVPQRRLKLFTDVNEDRDRLVEALETSPIDGERAEVWVSPGIPLLFCSWLALLLNAFIGDILLWPVAGLVALVMR